MTELRQYGATTEMESDKKEVRVKAMDSIVESLVGILPDDDKSLDDYRGERLSKYEIAD